MKIVKSFEELPEAVRRKVDDALAEDILERYNSPEYQDGNIISGVLAEHGYKLEN